MESINIKRFLSESDDSSETIQNNIEKEDRNTQESSDSKESDKNKDKNETKEEDEAEEIEKPINEEQILYKTPHCAQYEIVKTSKNKLEKYEEYYQCARCQKSFKLEDHRCYSKECSFVEDCDLCNDFECVKCSSKYNLSHGACVPGEFLINLEISLAVLVPLAIVLILIFLIIISKKRRKEPLTKKVYSANMLSKKRIVSGQYIIMGQTYPDHKPINSDETSMNGDSNLKDSQIKATQDIKTERNCIVCKDNRIFSFAQCGCCLCKAHTMAIKKNKNEIICPIHGVKLTDNLSIKKNKKKKIDVKTVSDLISEGIHLCQFCNIYPGTKDYSNNYSIMICEKCYLKLFSN